MSFIEELKWRGLIQDITPAFEDEIKQKKRVGYIGFDPTSDSLHIGSLVQLVILKHFQNYGHKPIVLIGGATGMIGDPSGKSKERNLLSQEIINKNINSLKDQFSNFLSFDSSENSAIVLNNFQWTNKLNVIDFFRDFGKSLTVNYMMSKESVKKRLINESKEGMSFTEFTYQLFQAYDFYYLFKKFKCTIQMGGSDQWGNITTGTELIRRKENVKAFAITCPLIKKSDGSKFGKSEGGNIWLDKNKTSVYKFYQYWLNISDEDATTYIKVFTFLSQDEVNELIKEHNKDKAKRLLQNKIADTVTVMVHGENDLKNAISASKVLFGKSSKEDLESLDDNTFNEIFDGVPSSNISKEKLSKGIEVENLLATETNFLKSVSEARRALKENSISINKKRISQNIKITKNDLINGKYTLLQRGRKNYYLVIVN